MKIQKLTHITSLAALVLLVLFSGSAMAQGGVTVAPGRVDPIKRPNNLAIPITSLDPTVVRGLEAVAAAADTTVWVTNTNRCDTEDRCAVVLFTGADQLTAGNTLRVGALYIREGSESLPAGYYTVELTRQPRGHDLTFVESSVRPDGTVEGPTEKRMHKPFTIVKEWGAVRFVKKDGKEFLDTTTLGGDIGAAAKQVVNKSKSNVKNN